MDVSMSSQRVSFLTCAMPPTMRWLMVTLSSSSWYRLAWWADCTSASVALFTALPADWNMWNSEVKLLPADWNMWHSEVNLPQTEINHTNERNSPTPYLHDLHSLRLIAQNTVNHSLFIEIKISIPSVFWTVVGQLAFDPWSQRLIKDLYGTDYQLEAIKLINCANAFNLCMLSACKFLRNNQNVIKSTDVIVIQWYLYKHLPNMLPT